MNGVEFGHGVLRPRLASLLADLAPAPTSVHLVMDRRARAAAGDAAEKACEEAGFACTVHHPAGGEAGKDLERLARLVRAMVRAGMDRESLVVAVGGGVTSDLAGFAAAVALRGVRWGVVPTTLLAMADAAIGGKTGVNLPEGKNLAGAFHFPEFVLADTATLRTLPARQWRCGLGEIVKTAMLSGERMLSSLESAEAGELLRPSPVLTDLVAAAGRHKIAVVQRDPREGSARKLLNLGHTFGHALETAAGARRLTHGEAVALGLLCATRFAVEEGVAKPNYEERVRALVAHCGLPRRVPGGLPPARRLRALIARDKKARGGAVDVIAPERPGRCRIVTGVAPERVAATLRAALAE